MASIRAIKYIKINRFDEQGNDNTLSLQELTKVRLLLTDLGILEFDIITISEYPTYYLYVIRDLSLGYVTSSFKSPLHPSSSVDTYTLALGNNTTPIMYGYSNVTGSISSSGVYKFTPYANLPVTLNCSFSASSAIDLARNDFYILFTGSNGIRSKQSFNPSTSGIGSYTASYTFVPSEQENIGVAFASSSITLNFNLPSINFEVIQLVTSSVDNNILNHNFSASAYTASTKLYTNDGQTWSGSGLLASQDYLSYFNSTSSKYIYGDTPNIRIAVSASVNFENGLQGSFAIRRNLTETIVQSSSAFAAGIYSMSATFTPLETDNLQFFIFNENGGGIPATSSNIQWSFRQLETPYSGSNLTVLEPYLTTPFEYNDCNALFGNATGLEYDSNFMQVNYESGTTIPTNQEELILRTAEISSVKEYNYEANAQVLPRYNGVKLIQQNDNIWTEGDTSFGKEPSVQDLGTYFAYFDYMIGTNYELINKKAAHILYLIDSDGVVQTPTIESPYYPNLVQNFAKGNANVVFETSTGNASNIQGIRPIIKAGVYPKPIIYSQTGSTNNSSANILFDNIYEASNIPSYITSVAYAGRTSQAPAYYNLLDSIVVSEVINSVNTTANIGAYADRNIEIDVDTNKTQGIVSVYLNNFSLTNLSFFGFPISRNIIIHLVKYDITSGTWISIKNTTFWQTTGAAPTSITLTSDPQVLKDGDKYRATIGISGGGSILMNWLNGTLSLSQNPSPSAITVNPPYWTTGSLSKNILTGSAFTGSYFPAFPIYQTFPTSSVDSPYADVLPFKVIQNDEIRFEGDETQTYNINEVEGTEVNGNLYLTLNRDIVDGTDLDAFLLRRFTTDPGSILLDIPAEGGGTGFIFPEYTTLELQRNFSNIIKSLKEKGLIPV